MIKKDQLRVGAGVGYNYDKWDSQTPILGQDAYINAQYTEVALPIFIKYEHIYDSQLSFNIKFLFSLGIAGRWGHNMINGMGEPDDATHAHISYMGRLSTNVIFKDFTFGPFMQYKIISRTLNDKGVQQLVGPGNYVNNIFYGIKLGYNF